MIVNDLSAIVRLVVKNVPKTCYNRIEQERGDHATEAEVATKVRLQCQLEPAEEDTDLLIGEESSFQLANDSDHVLVEMDGECKVVRRGHFVFVNSVSDPLRSNARPW